LNIKNEKQKIPQFRSLPVFSEVRVTRSLVLCVCFVDMFCYICPFVLLLLVIVLSVLLRYTDSNYPFSIFTVLIWSGYGIGFCFVCFMFFCFVCLRPMCRMLQISGLSIADETEVPDQNHRPAVNHWQTLSHNVVSSTWAWTGF
jgi:hypothetical protein